MEISLKGRKALVGGATRGLGKAIAMQLAECGAEVTLMARNEEKLKTTLTELSSNGGQQHNYLVVDFADFESFKTIIAAWFEHHQVDILINNTNGPAAGGPLDKTVDDYQQSFDLLFKTVCFVTMEALDGMRAAKYGRIINLSSITVREPVQNLVLSNSIRSAVISWSKTLAREIAPDGITVNNIMTGYFDTERLNEIYKLQSENKGIPLNNYKDKMKMDIPVGRFGDPEEFGQLAAFLASGFASYVTGANIPIDGGLLRSL
ncbi:MAG: SDR family oxidoreductase [Ferruginibacter sp.]